MGGAQHNGRGITHCVHKFVTSVDTAVSMTADPQQVRMASSNIDNSFMQNWQTSPHTPLGMKLIKPRKSLPSSRVILKLHYEVVQIDSSPS